MESLTSKKKTGLILLGLGVAGAALWYASSDAHAATLPEGEQDWSKPQPGDWPSGPTPSYSMPSDSTSSYDPYAGDPYSSSGGSASPSVTDYPNTYQSVPSSSTAPSTARGDATVQFYQQRLLEAGYDPGPIDGRYGSLTRRAVMDFQRDNSLTVDGILGPRTKAALDAAAGTPAPTSGLIGRRTQFWRAAGASSMSMVGRRKKAPPSPLAGLFGGSGVRGRWRV